MAMWGENVKFVMDIVTAKYQKIDQAVADIDESYEVLAKDAKDHKSKEHFNQALRSLELLQTTEVETLLDTVLSELHGKDKEKLENEMKEKFASRNAGLEKAKKIKAELKL